MLITLICIVVIDLETDQSEASSTKAGGEEVGSRDIPNWSPPEERVAAFTDYSISSSVVPRNKGEEREREVVSRGTSEQGTLYGADDLSFIERSSLCRRSNNTLKYWHGVETSVPCREVVPILEDPFHHIIKEVFCVILMLIISVFFRINRVGSEI